MKPVVPLCSPSLEIQIETLPEVAAVFYSLFATRTASRQLTRTAVPEAARVNAITSNIPAVPVATATRLARKGSSTWPTRLPVIRSDRATVSDKRLRGGFSQSPAARSSAMAGCHKDEM
jgi:hypothetical protein